MKVIIAGSRDIHDFSLVKLTIESSGLQITEVVCGEASGVDTCGKLWAEENHIPIKSYPADWIKLGRSAGHVRNKQMAEYADALICIHNGSRGSLNMIKQASKLGLQIIEKRL